MNSDPSKPPSNGSQHYYPGERDYPNEFELRANAGMSYSGYVVTSHKWLKVRLPLGKGMNRWEDQKHL